METVPCWRGGTAADAGVHLDETPASFEPRLISRHKIPRFAFEKFRKPTPLTTR